MPDLQQGPALKWVSSAALLDLGSAEEVSQSMKCLQTNCVSFRKSSEGSYAPGTVLGKGRDNICEQNTQDLCSKGVCILVGEDRISKISRKMITEG